MKREIDRIKASLRTPSEYRRIIAKLSRLSRRRGRPRRRRFLRGGPSRSQSDIIVICALEAGKSRIRDICDYGGLPQSTVYRRLVDLARRGLVTSKGRPQEWHLIGDHRKVAEYELRRLPHLKSAHFLSLQDFKRRLELNEYLARTGDEAVRRYIFHQGTTEDFMKNIEREEKEEEREKERVGSFKRFLEVESRNKGIPYLDRRAQHKWLQRRAIGTK